MHTLITEKFNANTGDYTAILTEPVDDTTSGLIVDYSKSYCPVKEFYRHRLLIDVENNIILYTINADLVGYLHANHRKEAPKAAE